MFWPSLHHPHSALLCPALQLLYSTLPYSTLPCPTLLYPPYPTLPYPTLPYPPCPTLPYPALGSRKRPHNPNRLTSYGNRGPLRGFGLRQLTLLHNYRVVGGTSGLILAYFALFLYLPSSFVIFSIHVYYSSYTCCYWSSFTYHLSSLYHHNVILHYCTCS